MKSPTNQLAQGIAHTIISFAVIVIFTIALAGWLPEIERFVQ